MSSIGVGGRSSSCGACKIRTLKKAVAEGALTALIEVDGGVSPRNARQVAEAGADILVMGSAFFKSGNYRDWYRNSEESSKAGRESDVKAARQRRGTS